MKRIILRLFAAALAVCCLTASVSALTLEQASMLIDAYHIDGLPADAHKAQSVDELVALLGDKYSTYLSPEAYQSFLDSINDDTIVGIGVSIEPHEDGLYISSVVNGSPAQEAGMEAGDIILTVDGVNITATEDATAALGGQIDEPVVLTVRKKDSSVVQYDLIRREFTVPTTFRATLTEDESACVIVTTSFGDLTPYHFRDTLQEHKDTVNAWIVDLSANIGGTTQSSAGSAGQFIGSAVMVYMRDARDEYQYVFTTTSVSDLTDKPVIVLTSEYTASGAELFTSDMRDLGAGIAIGQRTTGKGVAQIVFNNSTHPDFFQDDALKLTTYRFFSPVGTTNDQGGIIPTLLISPENTYAAARLLCADPPVPEHFGEYLNLTLCDFEFYIHLETALSPDYRPAFVELMEALPPDAQLWLSQGTRTWHPVETSLVVQQLGLTEYRMRTFTDLGSSPYAKSVNILATYDLVKGYGDSTFRPDSLISRAEFCALLVNALGLSYSDSQPCPFYDISPSDWYYAPVMALYQGGYVSGYSNGSFGPNQTISQQEMISILAQAGAWMNMNIYDKASKGMPDEVQELYSDFSPWAREYAWLLDISGVDLTQVQPEQRATRGQAADLLCQLLTNTKYIWPVTYETEAEQ